MIMSVKTWRKMNFLDSVMKFGETSLDMSSSTRHVTRDAIESESINFILQLERETFNKNGFHTAFGSTVFKYTSAVT